MDSCGDCFWPGSVLPIGDISSVWTVRWAVGLFVSLAMFGAILGHPALVTLLYWSIDGFLDRPYLEGHYTSGDKTFAARHPRWINDCPCQHHHGKNQKGKRAEKASIMCRRQFHFYFLRSPMACGA